LLDHRTPKVSVCKRGGEPWLARRVDKERPIDSSSNREGLFGYVLSHFLQFE
jgi:hypothetical protein